MILSLGGGPPIVECPDTPLAGGVWVACEAARILGPEVAWMTQQVIACVAIATILVLLSWNAEKQRRSARSS